MRLILFSSGTSSRRLATGAEWSNDGDAFCVFSRGAWHLRAAEASGGLGGPSAGQELGGLLPTPADLLYNKERQRSHGHVRE